MGAWGTAIFSDDLALDLQEDYKELLGDGHDGPEATQILRARWEQDLTDPDVESVFWLALAATQWKYGRLEDLVKAKALEIIDSGQDLSRWQGDPRALKMRRQVLENLRRQLESPPPPPKKVRKIYRSTCNWEVGEIIAYRLRSGRLVLLRVLGLRVDRGGIMPTCEALDWVGESLPPPKVLKRLPVRPSRTKRTDEELALLGVTPESLRMLQGLTGAGLNWNGLRRPQPQFMLCRTTEKELPADRVQPLGIKVPPTRQPGISRTVLWRELDIYLAEVFGLT